ncbi:MAG: FAD-dependent oxidoreductase [Thermoleophilia bacterium]|nr:FAD-dependent oxidoreductase [Thermoleophilia bacterium]
MPPGLAARDDVADVHYVPAPCQVACPVGTDAPSYIAHIWEGKLEEAFEAITATNPFSSVCGRVCDAPCEPACRRADSDGPLAIRNLKRYVMDRLGAAWRPQPVAVARTETVGIVGGGPAGLTAAQDLAEAGYEVHVYEQTSSLGGYMTWGIPAFRCPPEVFREDIDRLLARCPGLHVHLDTALGAGVTLDELKERHDAVLLTIGAWWGKGARLEAAEAADGRVVDGVTFLRRVNGGERPTLPERVLVIGAGDVAMDACRAARRLPGCRDVKVLYRRGPEEIPARQDELRGAIEEGIEIVYNVAPVGVAAGPDGGFALRCSRTELGEPDASGRRRPVDVPGSEHDVECGLVILATGQKAESGHLARHGLMADDKVQTDWETMRTADPKVFAAGDGAFGPSTIVNAMYHGHRAAYYVKRFLEGDGSPLPYRTPYRTRRVPVAQDPSWEVFPREHQAFHGLGQNPVAFPEAESGYDDAAARREAARCFRCDAETGSSDYNVRAREDIFVMARTGPESARTQHAIFTRRLAASGRAHFRPEEPALDDLVFLPANLSRLVIDPYRDACTVSVRLGAALELGAPLVAAGFDDAPDPVRRAVAHGLRELGLAYLGRRPLGHHDVRWLQLVSGDDEARPEAAAVLRLGPGAIPERLHGNQLAGIVATVAELPEAIPAALERGLDLLLVDGSGDLGGRWPELAGPPDLTAIRDTIAIMRALNREEDLAILWFGGVRSGTDAAKLIALGANAATVALALALAVGGRIEGGGVAFYGDVEQAERDEQAALFLTALRTEASIMPRCTGKTDIRNLEPEDLRAISLATAAATGIPLAGRNQRLAGIPPE